MRKPREIKGFCSKNCYLWPSSKLFMNVMQLPEPDLPYVTVPGAPTVAHPGGGGCKKQHNFVNITQFATIYYIYFSLNNHLICS